MRSISFARGYSTVSPSEARSRRVSYRKLPGDYRGVLRRNSLWLADDHLLLVDSTRFSETYKRFYLRDIQTILVRRAPRFVLSVYWLLVALAAFVVLLIGLNPSRQPLFWTGVAILSGEALYLYLASVFQSCVCHLITRANNVELLALVRLRSASRFVEIMVPHIVAAQGALPADWLERSTTLEDLTHPAPNPGSTVELLPAARFSFLTTLVFLLVLIDATLTWLQLRFNDAHYLAVPNMVNMGALAICATIVIVRLTRRKGGRALRMLVLAGLFVVAAVTYGSVVVQSFDQQFFHKTYANVLQYPGVRQLGIAEIVADFAVAAPGLILCLRALRGEVGSAKP